MTRTSTHTHTPKGLTAHTHTPHSSLSQLVEDDENFDARFTVDPDWPDVTPIRVDLISRFNDDDQDRNSTTDFVLSVGQSPAKVMGTGQGQTTRSWGSGGVRRCSGTVTLQGHGAVSESDGKVIGSRLVKCQGHGVVAGSDNKVTCQGHGQGEGSWSSVWVRWWQGHEWQGTGSQGTTSG